MTFLPDVNVWIALTSTRHVHHGRARTWLDSLSDANLVFCRITEMGFLRLLTNDRVMGVDVVKPEGAWMLYDRWRRDDRVLFAPEGHDFDVLWRTQSAGLAGGPNVWTDAYLSAFAAAQELKLVTFDQSFARRSSALCLG